MFKVVNSKAVWLEEVTEEETGEKGRDGIEKFLSLTFTPRELGPLEESEQKNTPWFNSALGWAYSVGRQRAERTVWRPAALW